MDLDFAIASKTLCCTACVALHRGAFLQVEKKKNRKKNSPPKKKNLKKKIKRERR